MMKVCVMQPPYSSDLTKADEYFAFKLDCLSRCDASMDVIVLPEYSDVPAACRSAEETFALHEKFIGALLDACAETAARCSSLLFVNTLAEEDGAWYNTTLVFDRAGEIAARYRKRHLPPFEKEQLRLSPGDGDAFAEPFVLELEGLRFGFITCYDAYFYEAFPALARQNVDIIVDCALQRSDRQSATELMTRFLAYQTNACVLRSSVSLGAESDLCGASMIVAPDGEPLVNMHSKTGMACAEIDPKRKYYKPAGFGNPVKAHWEYIEYGRRPWLYRPAGPFIVPGDADMPYPRVCAHRGFNSVAPENSLPAFGAAVALGAQEIEFDVWATKDGELVVSHDPTLERVSDGVGMIYDHTCDALAALDFGIKRGDAFRGLRIVRFEDILRKFARQVVMNIHMKIWDETDGNDRLEQVVSLIKQYDCQDHMYFMTANDDMVRRVHAAHPELRVCVGWDGNRDPLSIVDRAISLGAYKVQLFKPYFNQETVDKAHAHGILCNVFYADDPEEALRYRDMGIDTILTNDYQRIASALSV